MVLLQASEWGKKLLSITEQLPKDDQSDRIAVLMENIESK